MYKLFSWRWNKFFKLIIWLGYNKSMKSISTCTFIIMYSINIFEFIDCIISVFVGDKSTKYKLKPVCNCCKTGLTCFYLGSYWLVATIRSFWLVRNDVAESVASAKKFGQETRVEHSISSDSSSFFVLNIWFFNTMAQ